jgi:hypothetical protein
MYFRNEILLTILLSLRENDTAFKYGRAYIGMRYTPYTDVQAVLQTKQ